MKNVKRDEWQFELNGKTWNLFDASDAEAFEALILDAKRYRFIRNSNGYIRTLPNVHMLEPEKLDAAVDEGIAIVQRSIKP